MEQTSTTISGRFDRVVNTLPQDAQRTVVRVSSGWMCCIGCLLEMGTAQASVIRAPSAAGPARNPPSLSRTRW